MNIKHGFIIHINVIACVVIFFTTQNSLGADKYSEVGMKESIIEARLPNVLTPYQQAEARYAISATLAQAEEQEYYQAWYRDQQQSLPQYRAYEQFKINQRERALTVQYYFSLFTFVAIIIFLLFGCYLAYRQFNRDLNNPDKSVSTIKFSLKEGMEISSSVMGLMVLFLSLLFFYLFLKEVYPVSEIGKSNKNIGMLEQQSDLHDKPAVK